jgi:hypothetical protein
MLRHIARQGGVVVEHGCSYSELTYNLHPADGWRREHHKDLNLLIARRLDARALPTQGVACADWTCSGARALQLLHFSLAKPHQVK